MRSFRISAAVWPTFWRSAPETESFPAFASSAIAGLTMACADAAAAVAYAGTQRVLVPLFDDHGNVGFDFAGNGVSGKMEIGVGRNAEVHGAGSGLEIPIT